MRRETSSTIVGAITWIDEEEGHSYATITCAATARGTTVAIANDTPLGRMVSDARIHGDQIELVILRRGIDPANPHDPRPVVEAVEGRLTRRTPRLGETTRDNVVEILIASRPARRLAA